MKFIHQFKGVLLSTWDLKDLEHSVLLKYGKPQSLKVAECLQSVLTRLNHAAFHIKEFEVLEDQVTAGRDTLELITEIFQIHETRISDITLKAGAHALAAVQALHSIADIMGTAIVFSLTDKTSWSGYWAEAKKLLPSGASSIKKLMSELDSHTDYLHLRELVNHSKHTNVVRTRFMTHMTGSGKNRYEFMPFERKSTGYAPRDVRDFLISEFNRQGRLVFEIGLELNIFAKSRQSVSPSVSVKTSII